MRRPAPYLAIFAASALGVAGLTWLLTLFVQFHRPERLLFAALPVLGLGVWLGHEFWRARALQKIGDPDTLQSLTTNQAAWRRPVRAACLGLAGLLSAYAFAVPQWGEESREVERRGIDVVVAFDVSRSMLAEDVPPSRLKAAVTEVEALLRSLRGDRVGLVVYAGVAFTQSPLTSDYGAIRLYLDRLDPDDLPSQGTAIGRAIEEGRRLLTGGESESFQRAQNQLLIVVSDGEDHETDPVEAARVAAADGIRVFTVGVGTAEGARIPVRDAAGSIREYLTDREGEVVTTRLEDEQLRDIAAAGGGQYLNYSGEGTVARQLNRAIDTFDDEALSSILRPEYVDRPSFFLVPAALLLLIYFLLGARWRRRVVMSAMSAVLFTTGCEGIERNDPTVREAIEASEAEEHQVAQEKIEQANEEAREQAAYWFDRGLIHERGESRDEALDAYLRSLGIAEPSLQDESLVGIGNVLLAQEDYRDARQRYERALSLNPDNAAARRNLEIALLREFPPCRTLDDEFEENDSPDTAKTIPETALVGDFAPRGMQLPGAQMPGQAGSGGQPGSTSDEDSAGLVSCGENNDYFRIPVHGGDLLTVKASFERLRDDNGGPPLPEQIPPTDVRLSLLTPDGEEVLAGDQGLEANESSTVSAERVERSIEELPIPRELGADGEVLLLIESDGPLEYRYELEVAVIPPCRVLEDEFEENDSRLSAVPIESGEQTGVACVDDPDWYAVSVEAGDDLFVDVSPGVSPTQEPAFTSIRMAASPSSETFSTAETGAESLAAVSARDIAESGALPFVVESHLETEGQYPFEVFHFPPCPEGGDRYEPNDSRRSASQVTAEDAPIRHLRLCEGDSDWFVLTLPQPPEAEESDEEESEPEPIPFSALATYEGSARDVRVELYDAQRGRFIAGSPDEMNDPSPRTQTEPNPEPVADGSPEEDAGVEAPEDTQGTAIAAAVLPPETQQVVVRITGDEGYYHLSFPDTEAQQQQQQQQSDESSDSDGESEDESNADTGENDEAEDEQEASEESQPEDAQDSGDSRDQESAQANEQSEEEADREALLRLLNSLEDEDVNLQLRQALEDLPPRAMRNEW